MEKPIRINSIDTILLEAAVVFGNSGLDRGTIILVHGITATMDEGGMYQRLSTSLSNVGFTVVRFSFRGHGKSGGTQEGMTIAGEILDLLSIWNYVKEHSSAPCSIIASSFGAVSTLELIPLLNPTPISIVLWNPVLDLDNTFLNPTLPWGVENFGNVRLTEIKKKGFILIDNQYRLGQALWNEFSLYKPLDKLLALTMPNLIIHGRFDTSVSYEIAASASRMHPLSSLYSVDADHGFSPSSIEDIVIEKTVGWLTSIYL